MLNQGLTLTIAGMATVFSFLVLLVIVMSQCSRIILHFVSDKIEEPSPGKKIKTDDSVKIAIAIAAAARKEGKIR
jgi:sodium pump decarboxylase gamma subunit